MKNITIGNITFENKEIWSPKPGMNVVNKAGIQRIADHFNVFPKIEKIELIGDQYVAIVSAEYNGAVIQMVGTASDNNLANEIAKAFPIDMAYKRAFGKVVCEMLRRDAGVTDLFYSIDEMNNGLNNDINEDKLEEKSAPKTRKRRAPAIENVEEVTVETPVEEPVPTVEEPVAEPEVVADNEPSEEAISEIVEDPVTETEETVEVVEAVEEVTEEPAAEDVAAEEVPVEEPIEEEIVAEEVAVEEPVEVEEPTAEDVAVEETPVEPEAVPAEDDSEAFWNERIELKSAVGTVREVFENRPDIAKAWAVAAPNNNPKYQRVTNLMKQAFKASGREDELN